MWICTSKFHFSTMSLSPPGGSSDYQRSVYKLKRFLSTLIKFGTDISGPVGDKVRDMIFNLVVSLSYISCDETLVLKYCGDEFMSQHRKRTSNKFHISVDIFAYFQSYLAVISKISGVSLI